MRTQTGVVSGGTEEKTSVRPRASQITFGDGMRAMMPFWPGAALFGIVYAVAARAAGLTGAETLVMSVLVHAGSAQFAATGLIGSGAGSFAVTLATAITNARYVLMSASVAPRVECRPVWWRALYAWQLSDESYAVTTARFLAGDSTDAFAYGTNVGMVVPWLAGTMVGIIAGGAVPDAWRGGVNLVGPLIFLSLLVPLLHTKRALCVALVAGVIALLGAAILPGASYLLVAGIGGAVLGGILESRSDSATEKGNAQ